MIFQILEPLLNLNTRNFPRSDWCSICDVWLLLHYNRRIALIFETKHLCQAGARSLGSRKKHSDLYTWWWWWWWWWHWRWWWWWWSWYLVAMTKYLREIVIPIIIKADSVPVHQNERFISDNVLPLLFCNREIERELTSDPCTTPSFASVIKQPCLQSCKKLRNNMNPEYDSKIEQPSTCNL